MWTNQQQPHWCSTQRHLCGERPQQDFTASWRFRIRDSSHFLTCLCSLQPSVADILNLAWWTSTVAWWGFVGCKSNDTFQAMLAACRHLRGPSCSAAAALIFSAPCSYNLANMCWLLFIDDSDCISSFSGLWPSSYCMDWSTTAGSTKVDILPLMCMHKYLCELMGSLISSYYLPHISVTCYDFIKKGESVNSKIPKKQNKTPDENSEPTESHISFNKCYNTVWIIICRRWCPGGRLRDKGEQLCDHPKPVLLYKHHQLLQRAAGLWKLLTVGFSGASADLCLRSHTCWTHCMVPAKYPSLSPIGCSMQRG